MSDSDDSDESLFERHRATKWRMKRKLTESDSDSSDNSMVIEGAANISDSDQPIGSAPRSDEDLAEPSKSDFEAEDDDDIGLDGNHQEDQHDDHENEEDHEDGNEDNVVGFEEDNEDDFVLLEEDQNDNGDEDDEDEEIEEDVNPALKFNEGAMNRLLSVHGNKTVKESLVLDLALSIRHKWTYESLIDNFTVKNLLFGTKLFPSSKKELFRILGWNKSGMVPYIYCDCGNLLGKKKDHAGVVKCGCGTEVTVSKAKVFYVLSLKQQFKQFLETPGIPELLKYRENREKQCNNSIEDVFDSQRYKELSRKMSPLDFTYNWNTDGCKISKGAKTGIYPVFCRVNELPPNLRQKYIFIIGIFGDKVEPNMETFLNPLTDEMNAIASQGVQWYPDGNPENEMQVSRFFPCCFCVDGKASSQILNMVNHSADYACSLCTFKGAHINGTQRYPNTPHPMIPPCEARTHAQMINHMIQASTHPEQAPVFGLKGLSALAALNDFDLVDGKGFDDLHFLYECAAKVHFELLLKTEAARVLDPATKKPISYALLERTFDARLSKIRTPSKIARKPANMKLKNREQFSGTEWRNILLYYAVPCFQGLIRPSYIKHLEMLSHAAHILSRDVIFNEEIDKAEQLIDKYLPTFDEYFGVEKTRLNLHTLKHAANSVRILGALWVYTTFNFESWNHKILTNVSSPKDPLLQIIMRHLILMFLRYLSTSTSENLSDEVKEKLAEILQVKRLRSNAIKIEEHVHVLDPVQERMPIDPIKEIIEREGTSVEMLTFYNKISVHGCEYQTRESRKADALSDDSMVYTKQDTFCTIEKIVVCQDMEGNKTAGLIVFEHDVLPQQSSHICRLYPQQFDLIHFVPSNLIKCPVVQIPINDTLSVAPLPKTYEID